MSEEVTRAFLVRLWELQAEAGISNADLARRLGCHPSYIRHLKIGDRKRIGLDIALNAAKIFPELRHFFLSSELPVSNTDVPQGNETTESES
jgi:plasmid maintenance system antidote protein VapI